MTLRPYLLLLFVASPWAVLAEPVPAAGASAIDLPFGAQATVDATDLARIAGQADVNQALQAQNSATVSNNTVSGNSETGTIAFDGQSFQGLNGLSLLSANTGNNVAINSSLNVNVALHP